MYITDKFKNKNQVFSAEVFPPNKKNTMNDVTSVVTELSSLPFDYISVTYGAGGSTSKKTADIAAFMTNSLKLTALAHLTCISSSESKIKEELLNLKEKGVENILALRGDIPTDPNAVISEDYRHASDLIREIRNFGGFCIGAACYPECHPESASEEEDILYLKEKVEAGAGFLVTQMFFDNNAFYRFRDRAAAKGIDVPITAGIMPITNINQIKRMSILSGGATIPSKFTRMIAKYANNPRAFKQAGLAYAIDQITDLMSNDVSGVHLYTMNKPEIAKSIAGAVDTLFE